MTSLRPPCKTILVVALFAIAGGALRCTISERELLWLDELHTSWAISGTMGEVSGRAADGNQLPVYFWLTWISVYLIGPSEFSMRMISILAGVGILGLSAWLAWRWTSSEIAAGLVACLIAIDSQFLYYSTEARPYALLQLFGVAQVFLFWKACWAPRDSASGTADKFSPHWVLVIVSTLMVYTQLTAIWLFVAEAFFLAAGCLFSQISYRLGRNSPNFIQKGAAARLLISGLVVAIASFPAIAHLIFVFQRRGNWEMISSIEGLLFETWNRLAWWIALPIICLMVDCLLRRSNQSNSKGPDRELNSELFRSDKSTTPMVWKLVFVCLWAVVPVGMITGLDYFNIAPLALPRYALVGSVAFPIFAGLVVGCFSNELAKLSLSLLIVAAIGIQNPVIQCGFVDRELYQFRVEDWSSPIAELNATGVNQNYPLFLFANLIEDRAAFDNPDARFQEYLRFPIHGLYETDDSDRETVAGPTLALTHFEDEHIRLVTERGGAWILIRDRPEKVLVSEIANEIRAKTAAATNCKTNEINVSVREVSPSPVYLLLIDW